MGMEFFLFFFSCIYGGKFFRTRRERKREREGISLENSSSNSKTIVHVDESG